MVVLSYSVIYYIYIPRALGPCFHYWCSVYGIFKLSDTLGPVGRVRLFADYTISLSSLCRLICRHWTTKMLVRYMRPSVCVRLRQFSQLSFIQYMALCVFSLPNYLVMIVIMCTLSYYHHQTGSMNHSPMFRVRSWNNGMRCMSYYVLIIKGPYYWRFAMSDRAGEKNQHDTRSLLSAIWYILLLISTRILLSTNCQVYCCIAKKSSLGKKAYGFYISFSMVVRRLAA